MSYALGVAIIYAASVWTFVYLAVKMTDSKIFKIFFLIIALGLSLLAAPLSREFVEQDADIAIKTDFYNFMDGWWIGHVSVVLIFFLLFVTLFIVDVAKDFIFNQKIKRGEVTRSEVFRFREERR